MYVLRDVLHAIQEQEKGQGAEGSLRWRVRVPKSKWNLSLVLEYTLRIKGHGQREIGYRE